MKVIETFRNIGSHEIYGLIQQEPSSFNGNIRVKRYRITVEEIPEPDEVIKARIQKLWDECGNHHHWDPLKKEAAKYGMVLSRETRKAKT